MTVCWQHWMLVSSAQCHAVFHYLQQQYRNWQQLVKVIRRMAAAHRRFICQLVSMCAPILYTPTSIRTVPELPLLNHLSTFTTGREGMYWAGHLSPSKLPLHVWGCGTPSTGVSDLQISEGAEAVSTQKFSVLIWPYIWLFSSSGFFFLFFLAYSQPSQMRLDVYHTSTYDVVLVRI